MNAVHAILQQLDARHKAAIGDGVTRMELLEQAMAIEGMEMHDMLEEAMLDAVAPGICTNPGCTFMERYEPDQDEGYCEICQTNTVCSVLRLADMI